jgi:hypothetical protein
MPAKLLWGALLVGGAYVLYTRTSLIPHPESDEPERPPYTPGPPPTVPPGWDEMVGLYQTCIYGHCTPTDCRRLLEYIDSLSPETEAEEEWLSDVRVQVLAGCAATPFTPSAGNQSLDPAMLALWTKCTTSNCTLLELQTLLGYAQSLTPETSDEALWLQSVINEVNRLISINQTGTQGIHVGNCGCDECKQKHLGEPACCDECAAGVGACSCSREEKKVAGT